MSIRERMAIALERFLQTRLNVVVLRSWIVH
jgi:hypothetical protein